MASLHYVLLLKTFIACAMLSSFTTANEAETEKLKEEEAAREHEQNSSSFLLQNSSSFLLLFALLVLIITIWLFGGLRNSIVCGQDQNVLDRLKELRLATCLIEAGGCRGTGFHFGSGWVMSVAHNFQDDDDDHNVHSLLHSAKFTFPGDTDRNGQPIVFDALIRENTKRMALIHHLRSGDAPDTVNMDIAMVKLGVQYEFDRDKSEYEDWEKEEQVQLQSMQGLKSFVDIINQNTAVEERDTVYAIHHGREATTVRWLVCWLVRWLVRRLFCCPDTAGQAKIVKHTVRSVNISGRLPTISLQPALGPGASGSPILNTECNLVGLFYSGNNDEGRALMWDNGIRRFINNIVSIVSNIGAYMKLRNLEDENVAVARDESEAQLQASAQSNHLTIYLMNEEEFNGQN